MVYVSLTVVQISPGVGGVSSERIWGEGRAHSGLVGEGHDQAP